MSTIGPYEVLRALAGEPDRDVYLVRAAGDDRRYVLELSRAAPAPGELARLQPGSRSSVVASRRPPVARPRRSTAWASRASGSTYGAVEHLSPAHALGHASRRPWPWRDAGVVVVELSQVLTRLHHADVFHGSIGPETVFLAEDGRLVLSGFSALRPRPAGSPPAREPTELDDVIGLRRTLGALLSTPEEVAASEHAGFFTPPSSLTSLVRRWPATLGDVAARIEAVLVGLAALACAVILRVDGAVIPTC